MHKINVAGSCRKSPFMQMSQAFRPMSCRFEKLRRFLLSQPRLLYSLTALQNLLFRQQHCFEKYRSDPGPLRHTTFPSKYFVLAEFHPPRLSFGGVMPPTPSFASLHYGLPYIIWQAIKKHTAVCHWLF